MALTSMRSRDKDAEYFSLIDRSPARAAVCTALLVGGALLRPGAIHAAGIDLDKLLNGAAGVSRRDTGQFQRQMQQDRTVRDCGQIKAWIDSIVAVSACPQEFNPVAGWYPTDLHVGIYEAA